MLSVENLKNTEKYSEENKQEPIITASLSSCFTALPKTREYASPFLACVSGDPVNMQTPNLTCESTWPRVSVTELQNYLCFCIRWDEYFLICLGISLIHFLLNIKYSYSLFCKIQDTIKKEINNNSNSTIKGSSLVTSRGLFYANTYYINVLIKLGSHYILFGFIFDLTFSNYYFFLSFNGYTVFLCMNIPQVI